MKIPTSCDVLQKHLKAHIDGELSAPRRLIVRAHLLRCAPCRAEVEIMKTIGHDLRDDETARPAAFGDALRQRILDKLPAPLATPPTFERATLRDSLANTARLNGRKANFILAGGLTTLVSVIAFSNFAGKANRFGLVRETEDRAIAARMQQSNDAKGIGGPVKIVGGKNEDATPPPPTAGQKLEQLAPSYLGGHLKAAPRTWDKEFNSDTEASANKSRIDALTPDQPQVSDNVNPATDEFVINNAQPSKSPIIAPTSGLSTSESGSKDTFSVQLDGQPAADATVHIDGANATFALKPEKSLRIAGLPPNMPPTSGGIRAESEPSILRRVHREARMSIAVDDIETQSDTVEQLVRGAGGYVVSNNLTTGSDNRKTATLDLRVPVGKFETIIGEFSRLGDVRAKNISGQDITEQYSDSQQAKNVLSSDLSVREAQLKAALVKAEKEAKRRRQAPEDPWQLRAEVRRLRVEAAQVRARLEILRKLSDLSQITVELQEKQPAPDKGFLGKEMRETGQAATETFLTAARFPLKVMLWFLAYSPLWLPLVLFYRWLFPRRTPATAPAAHEPPNASTTT